ncbi:hypothetical protein F5884DRAFT_863321 [Xylogone sp. PMI_703]|nr:hypothetical protein F5884DRAFT_863321 [Xylogone sp. PMI_703]
MTESSVGLRGQINDETIDDSDGSESEIINDSDGSEYDEDKLLELIRQDIAARKKPRNTPAIAFEIPQTIYDKARDHQEQLTDAERQLLLSRGDLIGKALAYPASLTNEERNIVLDRPSPEVLRTRIQLASRGKLSTVDELVSKARANIGSLSEDELELLANNFNENISEFMNSYNDAPGALEAKEVLLSHDEKKALTAAGMRQVWETTKQQLFAQRVERKRIAYERAYMQEYEQLEVEKKTILAQTSRLKEKEADLDEDERMRQIQNCRSKIEDVDRRKDILMRKPPYKEPKSYLTSILNAVKTFFWPSSGSSSAIRATTFPNPHIGGTRYSPLPGCRMPKSPQHFYEEEHKERIRMENPDASADHIKQMLRERWLSLPLEEKEPYIDMSNADERKCARYNEKLEIARLEERLAQAKARRQCNQQN